MKDLTSEIRQYVIDRNQAIREAIKTDSVEPFKEFVRKHAEAYPPCFELPSDNVIEISIRQMALHCTDIEPEIKGLAVDWLLSRGLHLDYTNPD